MELSSRVFKSNTRKVSAIAKNAGISKKRAILLNKLTSYLEIKNALELGTSVGISSASIAMENKVRLTTIEGCPETAKIAEEYFQKFELENIQLEVGSFEEFFSGEWRVESGKSETGKSGEWRVESGKSKLEKGESGEWRVESEDSELTNGESGMWKVESGESEAIKSKPKTENIERISKFQIPNSKQPISENRKHITDNRQPITDTRQPTTDLIYFDGNHQKEATLEYFHKLLPLAHNDSVFIFDDIHWSKGMEEAWEEIKNHPEVRVTIDSFFWGMVFFRREQEKEHFIIRL
ncbi:class I SAM-dependent methyltransferase [Antarcticibacterium sp. 1MA-6-2]|uniref:O-methyltransferase n=1 Tax=Antarcticibacterium sp. 1MA-6-2 TaxID=2908210 RepID=UPI001F278B05|nr:class I SAM-dependent methyltransferase [Antarcticibacterium sp. 1MA-6-2]UJH92555.1 class I SAM-dependent methyltransferase [Antarcticibacterium sp. 1MA-6-2]